MMEKRGQRAYDLAQKYRFTFVLHVVIPIVNKLVEPYALNPSVITDTHQDIVVFMMEELYLT